MSTSQLPSLTSTTAMNIEGDTNPDGTTADTAQRDNLGASAPGPTAPRTDPDATTDPAGSANADRNRNFSTASFVLGLVSVVAGWTFFAPLTGLILGIIALRGGTPDRTLTIWGIALNGAMLVLFALGLLLIAVLLTAGLFAIPFAA